LKAAVAQTPKKPRVSPGEQTLKSVVPILLVRDVSASAAFYRGKPGFELDFLHGSPPFFGSVSRDGVCLHLHHVQKPYFAQVAARERSLILATIEVADVHALFKEWKARNVPFP
jgi:catechol 2,3-dioxygenase-like lactoylglutathione lyase family enzyme